MSEIEKILAALAGTPPAPAALATLVRVTGSSYRRPGARLLVLKGHSPIGSISGGCLEEDIILRAERVLATGQAETAVYNTTSENDLVWGVGLGCQGIVHIMIEPVPIMRPEWIKVLAENLRTGHPTTLRTTYEGTSALGTTLASNGNRPALNSFQEKINAAPALLLFGAGDDARPLVRLAKELGWHVTVTDARAAYATAARFPAADRIVITPGEKIAEPDPTTRALFAVVMTHRYTEDLNLLRRLLPQSLAYLGVLGPRQRTDRLLTQLRAEGFSPDPTMLARLHAPVGLDLGGSTPETVALAIMAEMQCRLSGRSPIHLRDRAQPIHG